MTQNLEALLRRSVLYFDKTVVTGLEPSKLAPFFEGRSPRPLERELLRHLAVSFAVREMGVEDALIFSPKVPLCTEHLNMHALESGMPAVDVQVQQLAEYFAEGGRFQRFDWRRGRLYREYTHPDLDTIWKSTRKVAPGEKPSQIEELQRISEVLAARHVGELVRSAASAKISNAALGLSSDLAIEVSGASSQVTIGQVALSLPLPLTDNLTVRRLLEMRNDDADHYQAFQAALRVAIKEQIQATPEAGASQLAHEVMEDIVNPALVKIDRTLSVANEQAGRTAAVSGVAGMVMLTVGLVAAAPIVVPGLVIAAGGLAMSARERLKTQSDVKLEDMYFLWRATREPDRHAH